MLALLLGLMLQGPDNYQSRTHQDGVGTEWSMSFRDRTIHQDGSITFRTRSVSAKGTVSFSEKTYTSSGEPLQTSQEGSWGKLTMESLPDKTKRSIDGKESVETILRSKLADPTVFWFWKTHPQPNEVVTVTFAAANQPTTFQIKYTYLGQEEYEAAGRKLQAHKVREDPLGPNIGKVYTIRWFDDKGMDIGRYHKTTTSEFTTTLKAWK